MSLPLSDDKIKITDAVHGEIEFEPYFRDIMASEEFQRLRNIKQLGPASMVYPSANGSRYDHSIGVSYLANKLLDILEKNSKIKILPFHRKCVSIAGLLHDLGHGPYSHMWEYLMHTYFQQIYHHENISCRMVDRVLRRLPNVFENAEETEDGIRLIQSLIRCNLIDLEMQLGSNMYIAEIISNKFSEIDVDRVDYILRDFDHTRDEVENVDPTFSEFLESAQIIEGADGIKHINYSEGDLERIYCLFKYRSEMHKQIYQNPEVIASQILLCDFFMAAHDNHFKFNDTYRLDEITQNNVDLTSFLAFDDTIVEQIQSQLSDVTERIYVTLKHLIVNNQRFHRIKKDEYDQRRAHANYSGENFRVYKRSIDNPFRRFKIFLDRHLLYNGNNNRVVKEIDEVKRKLNLDVNHALEEDTDEEIFYYFVET